MEYVLALFLIQLETAVVLAAFWPDTAEGAYKPAIKAVSLPTAVQRAISSMLSVCGWVTLAGVAAGFLRRWLFPILPEGTSLLLTGLLELSNGIFSLPGAEPALTFFLSTIFVCFGGISVLLQISGAEPGLCTLAKVLCGTLAAVIFCRRVLPMSNSWFHVILGGGIYLGLCAFLLSKVLAVSDISRYNQRKTSGGSHDTTTAAASHSASV